MAEQVLFKAIGPDQKQKNVWAVHGQSLREALVLAGLDPGGTCGGRGTCGKCKVRIEGQIEPMGPEERNKLLPEEIKAGERLSCFCRVKDPITVRVDYSETIPALKAITGRSDLAAREKQVENRRVFIPGLDKQNPVPLLERIKVALPNLVMRIPPANFNELAALDRMGRPVLELHALIFEGREVRCLSRDKQNAYGVALDLGTTSLQGIMVDLNQGETTALTSHTNLQRVYGQDIISRISYCLENQEGLDNLHRILINGINSILEELAEQSGTQLDKVFSYTVVGNPIMLHFLLNSSVNGFGSAPYCGLFLSDYQTTAGALGFKASPEASVLLLPQIGGFAGSDLLAGLLTIQGLSDLRFLYLDIGTNGEIAVGNRGRICAATAAAGPAFEGGSITCGMRAVSGAIDRVSLSDGQLGFHVLGEAQARGWCGSGIIDLLGCLLEGGFIDRQGTFTAQAEEKLNMRPGIKGWEFILNNPGQSEVVFNQEDVRQVQLAKSAISTAIDILLKEAGLVYRDLDVVFLAGAFGSYIDPLPAMAIGLLPPVDSRLVRNIGNAAAEGAVRTLLSASCRHNALMLSQKVKYVELASQAGFQDMFLKNLNF